MFFLIKAVTNKSLNKSIKTIDQFFVLMQGRKLMLMHKVNVLKDTVTVYSTKKYFLKPLSPNEINIYQ